ncbi:heparan-sulfate 6-O-sulfotransferase 2 [Chrysoperla carnea]|uniref:heparan-sulfate 6-O-sulfotransferase 2 n=1 Tax=Chrysoperla carnea TaxID=189513 RepID=UPI001D06E706|nr:heparan-sulfate 6-O-sulfotransferase 2 [Chrysoperla carnea]
MVCVSSNINTRSVSIQVNQLAGSGSSDLSPLIKFNKSVDPMETTRSRLRSIAFVCVLFALSGIVGFGYFCPDKVCALTTRESVRELPLTYQSLVGLSYEDVLNDDFTFDMDSHDVMVFLHIQKTGGTSFGRHLVHDLDLERPCTCPRRRKRCYCFRPHSNQNWLFSRYSTGWKCGLHADWTELTGCVDRALDEHEGESAKRRYFYITLLRDPVARYLSEFRHVQRGATWRNSRHFCNGRTATVDELPPCYSGDTWIGVQLDEFMECGSNLAVNRQTRMLADLSLVGCYNTTYMPKAERDRVMLASAKRNLATMAYFGLTEYQKISQYVFEETFNLRFSVPFDQHNTTVSSITISNLSSKQIRKINELNNLDLELYEFAKKLLFERFHRLKRRDHDFQLRFNHLGELPNRIGATLFNWDNVIEDTSPSSTGEQ